MRLAVCLLVIVALLTVPTASHAQYRESILKGTHGIEKFGIAIDNADDREARSCLISEQALRSAVTNVLIPAGVKVSSSSSDITAGDIFISVPSLYFPGNRQCVSTLNFQVMRLVNYNSLGEEIAGFVELFHNSVILSSSASEHASRVLAQISRQATQFLGIWREANPDLARLTQAPPAKAAPSGNLALTRAQITDLQTKLRALGLYNGQPDGALGPGTKAAVASFQTSHGLHITGAVDWETLQELFKQ